jgi:hypothetical protein
MVMGYREMSPSAVMLLARTSEIPVTPPLAGAADKVDVVNVWL